MNEVTISRTKEASPCELASSVLGRLQIMELEHPLQADLWVVDRSAADPLEVDLWAADPWVAVLVVPLPKVPLVVALSVPPLF